MCLELPKSFCSWGEVFVLLPVSELNSTSLSKSGTFREAFGSDRIGAAGLLVCHLELSFGETNRF